MYGASTYGSTPYGAPAESGSNAIYCAITVVPEVTAVAAHSIGGSASITVPLLVQVGADSTPRTSTVVVNSFLTFSATGTFPTQTGVGDIAVLPVVSASGSTTVIGSAAVTASPSVSILSAAKVEATAAIAAPLVFSIRGAVQAGGSVSIVAPLAVSSTVTVHPACTASIAVRPVVSASAAAGRGIIAAVPVRAVFSASGVRGVSGTVPVVVRPAVNCSGFAGVTGMVSAQVAPAVTAIGHAYQSFSGSISCGVSPLVNIRSVYGDDSTLFDVVFVRSEETRIVVRS